MNRSSFSPPSGLNEDEHRKRVLRAGRAMINDARAENEPSADEWEDCELALNMMGS